MKPHPQPGANRMLFDLQGAAQGLGYKLLAATLLPRPIGWVTSQGETGVVNCAPFSFFNAAGSAPPCVSLAIQPGAAGLKDTARNILQGGEFVVNLVPFGLAEAMNLTCIDAPPDVSEVDLAGLALAPCARVAVPRLAASPVSYECRLLHDLETGPNQHLLVGEVLAVHVSDTHVIDAARGHIDGRRLDLIARGGAQDYYRQGEAFTLQRPVWDKPR